MLDEELGFHPMHERVKSGELQSYRGWDGEFGPFYERVGARRYVNFVAIEKSDYVSHALAGRIKVSLTADVQSSDILERKDALEQCWTILKAPFPTRDQYKPVCLVIFRKINDWQEFGGHKQLEGGGFLLEFAELKEKARDRKTTPEIPRVRREVRKSHICQVGSNGVAYKNGNEKLKFHPNSDPSALIS